VIFSNEQLMLSRVVGNLEPIGFTLQDNAGAAIDLTGRAVNFRLVNMDTGAAKVTGSACVVGSPANGEGYYQPVSTDLDTAGRYAVYFVDDATPPRRWPYDGAKFQLNLMPENKV
jgi:hypothetical protein